MTSAAFPYKKQRCKILGREMAYVEVGQGAERARTRDFGDPRLGFHPRLRLGQPPSRFREGYRLYGGDSGPAVSGEIGSAIAAWMKKLG